MVRLTWEEAMLLVMLSAVVGYSMGRSEWWAAAAAAIFVGLIIVVGARAPQPSPAPAERSE